MLGTLSHCGDNFSRHFGQGWAILWITFKIRKIPTGHIQPICSLGSKLFFVYICSIRIMARTWDIIKKPQLISRISSVLERILVRHIGQNCCSEPELFFVAISSIGIISSIWDIIEKRNLLRFSPISLFLEQIPTEHIDSKCSLETELFFVCLSSVRILNIFKDIDKNLKMLNPTLDRPYW